MVLFGGQDRTSTFPIQVKVMENFHANGQPLEWHYFHFGNHGFASTESDGYQPYLADLAWPRVTILAPRADRSCPVAREITSLRNKYNSITLVQNLP